MTLLKNIIAAFQFLTVLPLPVHTDGKNLAKSIAWFPLVGAVSGLITGFGYKALCLLFPQSISSAITILLYIILTRGLHLDGFMDTIDGFFSSKDRSAMLRIMKEPTVGSFAVLGAGVWFLVLFAALPRLNPAHHVMIHTFSRLGILLMPLLFSYPRESGTGKFFVENMNKKIFLFSVTLTIGISALLYFAAFHGTDSASASLIPITFAFLPASLVIASLIGKWSQKKIGGITGDVLGCAIEASNLLLILAIVAAL